MHRWPQAKQRTQPSGIGAYKTPSLVRLASKSFNVSASPIATFAQIYSGNSLFARRWPSKNPIAKKAKIPYVCSLKTQSRSRLLSFFEGVGSRQLMRGYVKSVFSHCPQAVGETNLTFFLHFVHSATRAFFSRLFSKETMSKILRLVNISLLSDKSY